MASGGEFTPIDVRANFAQAIEQTRAHAAALREGSAAATSYSGALEMTTKASNTSASAEQKLAAAMAQQNKIAQEQLFVLKSISSAQGQAASETVKHGAAAKGATEAFGHQKKEMKELVNIGQHLSGVNTGLAQIIGSALNPAMLLVAASAFLVGTALEEHRKHQEELNKTTNDAAMWVQEYSKKLDENRDKLLTFSEFQKSIVSVGREFGQINTAREIINTGEAAKKASTDLAAYESKFALMHPQLVMFSQKMSAAQVSMSSLTAEEKLAVLKLIEMRESATALALKLSDLQHPVQRNAELQDWYAKTLEAGRGAAERMKTPLERYHEGIEKLKQLFPIATNLQEGFRQGVAALNATLRQEEQQAAKARSGSAINERKQFYQRLEKVEADGEQDSLLRTLAGLAAEQKAEEAAARKIIHNKQEQFAALARIRAAYGKKMDVAVTTEENRQRAAIAETGKALMQEQKAVAMAGASQLKARSQFFMALDLLEMKHNKSKLKRFDAELKKEREEFREHAIAVGLTGQALQSAMTRFDAAGAEARKEIAKAEAAAKRDSAVAGINATLSAAQGAFGKSKALSVAQAVMSTYQSAVNAYASASAIPVVGWILGPIAAGLAVIAGLKNVATIKSQNVEGGGAAIGQAHKGMVFPFNTNGSYLMNVQKGETGAIFPNTDGLMSFSSAITRLAKNSERGRGGGGGDTFHFNSPVYAEPAHAIKHVRATRRVMKRRNAGAA